MLFVYLFCYLKCIINIESSSFESVILFCKTPNPNKNLQGNIGEKVIYHYMKKYTVYKPLLLHMLICGMVHH